MRLAAFRRTGLAAATVLCVALLAPAKPGGAQDAPAVPSFVPWPRIVKPGRGTLVLTDKIRIVPRDKSLVPLADVLSGELRLLTGLRLPVADGPPQDGDIELVLAADLEGDSYRLTVGDRATVAGAGFQGVAFGTATLLQAVRIGDGGAALPRLTVEDGPRLTYCGALLDVARKPYSIDTLRQCVEVCRFYKIRYLHLHLSDENAWVFPSTAFPKIGAGNFAWAGGEKPVVYELAALKALVAYADARGVTLFPEIEMPGHSGQLRAALPDVFGYRDAANKVVTPGVINMVREDSFRTLDTIIGEVCDVFRSSPYVHIGCDEAAADVAGIGEYPEVKAFLAEKKLSSPTDVFNAFVNRMHDIVKKHGKRTIVWEGAPLGPQAPPKDLIVMPWVGGSGSAAGFVKSGYGVINAPWGTPVAYFDPYLVNGAQLPRDEPLLLGATSILWQAPEEEAVPYLRHTGALRNEPTYNPDAGRGHADFLRRRATRTPSSTGCSTASRCGPTASSTRWRPCGPSRCSVRERHYLWKRPWARAPSGTPSTAVSRPPSPRRTRCRSG